MATIDITLTITTPAGITVAEAVDLFTQHHHYQALLPDGSSNPESKAAFAKRAIAKQVAEAIHAQRIQNASAAAAALEEAKTPITVD